VNSSHFPFAILAPLQQALHLPLHPSGSGSAVMTLTVKLSAIVRVRSLEWSSTTIIS